MSFVFGADFKLSTGANLNDFFNLLKTLFLTYLDLVILIT